jgi:hypothetical protein
MIRTNLLGKKADFYPVFCYIRDILLQNLFVLFILKFLRSSISYLKPIFRKDDFIIDGTAVSISIASPKQSLKPPQFPPFDMPISTGNYDRYEQRRDFDYYEHQPQYVIDF